MHYLCLLYYDIEAHARLTPEAGAALEAACKPHDAALNATGQVRITGSLAPPETWVHLVPRDGQPQRHAGPYLGLPQQPGAFLVIEADDDEAAVRVASKHAAANIGEALGFAVDVRRCDFYRAS